MLEIFDPLNCIPLQIHMLWIDLFGGMPFRQFLPRMEQKEPPREYLQSFLAAVPVQRVFYWDSIMNVQSNGYISITWYISVYKCFPVPPPSSIIIIIEATGCPLAHRDRCIITHNLWPATLHYLLYLLQCLMPVTSPSLVFGSVDHLTTTHCNLINYNSMCGCNFNYNLSMERVTIHPPTTELCCVHMRTDR